MSSIAYSLSSRLKLSPLHVDLPLSLEDDHGPNISPMRDFSCNWGCNFTNGFWWCIDSNYPMSFYIQGSELHLRLHTLPVDALPFTMSSVSCFLCPLHAFKASIMWDTLTHYLPSSAAYFIFCLCHTTGEQLLWPDHEEIFPKYHLSDTDLQLIMPDS